MRNQEPDLDHSALGVLDDPRTVERLDPHGLLGRIESLPEQCAEAWQHAAERTLPEGYARARGLVVLGMGGSAIAGDITRVLAAANGRKPVAVVRGYDLPPFVDHTYAVAACSHSGNTEEMLSAFEQTLARGIPAIAVTTGGRLDELAEQRGIPVWRYEYAGEPRSALGQQLMALLALAERLGALDAQSAAVDEALAVMRDLRERACFASPARENPAKQLAARLRGRLPVIVGAGVLTEAAHRWKTQLNENSKSWAFHDELPEADHNTVVGFPLPAAVATRVHVVFLRHPSLHERVRLRYEATADALDEQGVSHERVDAGGSSSLAQALSAAFLGDLVSYYLGLLNDVSPAPVVALNKLKARLAGS